MAAAPLVTSDETPILHAIRVVLLRATLLCSSCKRLRSRHRSCDVENVYLCPRLSVGLPFLISPFYFSFLLFVVLSVALSSISLVMCWNRETFAGSVRTVSLLSRIAACIDFNDRQYIVLE